MGLDDFSHREHDTNEQTFMLYCGGKVDPVQLHSVRPAPEPFKPSILPVPSSAASSSSHSHPHSHRPGSHDEPQTNGCGALVHLRAFSQQPRPVWVGKEEATDVVVSLEAQYFESAVVAKMMKSACGCVREGIGCAVWCVLLSICNAYLY